MLLIAFNAVWCAKTAYLVHKPGLEDDCLPVFLFPLVGKEQGGRSRGDFDLNPPQMPRLGPGKSLNAVGRERQAQP